MSDLNINFGGRSADNVYSSLLKQGVSRHDAGLFVSAWIYENLGYTLRTFSYTQNFEAHDPAPLGTFDQQFHHKPWRDGEDVVQAEPSATDDGFNRRFDNIERDLAALGTLFAGEIAKLEAMRESLYNRFEELRAEINRINSDILKLQQAEKTTPDLKPNFGGLIDNGLFLGTTTFMDKKVNLWKTSKGEMMMLPYINPVKEQDLVGKFAEGAGQLGKLFSERAEIREHFTGPVKKVELVERFGDVVMDNGVTVRDTVNVLSDETEFESLDKLVAEVADRNAAVIRTTEGGTAAIGAVLGVDPTRNFSSVPVSDLTNVTPEVKTALAKNNVRTVGELATLEPDQFATIMTREGIDQNAASGAKLRGLALTLTQVRGGLR